MSSTTQASIEAAAARLAAAGGTVLATAVDVSNGDHIAAWTKTTVDRFGGVDLLFTNSGGPPAGAAISFEDAAWKNAIDLLLFSALRMVRAVVPSKRKQRVDENLAALDIRLSGDDLKRISAAAPVGAGSGPRYPAEAMKRVYL